MSDDEREPSEDEQEPTPKPPKGKTRPVPKRGDFERLMQRNTKHPAKQRQAHVKPPPQRHQRRGS